MLYLSQRNPVWSAVRLGSSNSTVGGFGCTSVAISMLSSYFKCYVPPDALAHNAKNYIGDLINWGALKFTSMRFVKRLYGESVPTIVTALKDPNQGIILEVNLGKGKHWVTGLRTPFVWELNHKGDYLVADPWNAKKV